MRGSRCLPNLVAIGPGPGSLAEAAFAWQIGGRQGRLVLLGSDWRHWLAALWRWLVPNPSALAEVTIVDDAAEVVDHFRRPTQPKHHDPDEN